MTQKTESAAPRATTTQTATPPARSAPQWEVDTTPADWSTWAHIPQPWLWQAVALSLDLEPTAHKVSHYNLPENCETLPDVFHKRMFIASNNLKRLGIIPGPGDPVHILNVHITKFATWAKSIGWAMPEQFPVENERPERRRIGVSAADVAEPVNGVVRLSEEAARLGLTVLDMLNDAAKSKILLYAAIGPYEAKLIATRAHEAPLTGAIRITGHTTIPLLPQDAKSLTLADKISITKWQASFTGGALDWHYWVLDIPQTVTAENIFAARLAPDAEPGKIASDTAELQDSERTILLKIVGVAALILFEKKGKYQRGGKPNVSQIAQEFEVVMKDVPDVDKFGLGDTNLRDAISKGLQLLRK